MAPRIENLRESIPRAIRGVALGHLADAVAARARLDDPADAEALHDFRVALRRLRSWERAFRPSFSDDVSRKLRRRLRDLARDTGASRDLEVHLAWLEAQRGSLTDAQRPGLTWMVTRLRRQKRDADVQLRRDIARRFSRLSRRLHRALRSYREEVELRPEGRVAPPAAFASALAPRVREQAADLADQLREVRAIDDEAAAHEARIAAKRLRYLLEPVVKIVPGAAAVVDRLKSLQDVLGDLHDAHVFSREIDSVSAEATREAADAAAAPDSASPATGGDGANAVGGTMETAAAAAPEAEPVPQPAYDAAESTAATPPTGAWTVDALGSSPEAGERPIPHDPRPGLEEIGSRLRVRAEEAFASFAGGWLGSSGDAFFRDVEDVAVTIAAAVSAGLEIERKYLLRFLPRKVRRGRRLDIEQGYLPGDQVLERVRRVISRPRPGEREVRFFRTVKVGDGVVRTELEEETTRDVFAGLWRLTKGRRLRKRRFAVDDGDRTWEVDVFRDRELVLAEIELGSEDEAVVFPDWLAPSVEREVTTEPDYQNVNLAR